MAGLRAGAALSEHPLATHAVGECVGQLLDAGGHGPDLLLVVVTPPLTGALEDVTAAARRLLGPGTLLACTSAAVHGGTREVEHVGAVTMFALWGVAGGVRPVRLPPHGATAPGGPSGAVPLAEAGGTLLLLADPFSTDPPDLLADLRRTAPDVTVVGGFASAGRGPGGNLLTLDAAHHRDGAVGVSFGPAAAVDCVVSQGTRPVGVPLTVTDSERHVVRSLGGAPALERLREALEPLPPEDRVAAAHAVYLARVLDEHVPPPVGGAVLVRPLLGADRSSGAIALGPARRDGADPLDPEDGTDDAPVGATVQFHVRDATSVDADLRRVLAGRRAAGTLLLTGADRGSALFGVPDHDAMLVSDALHGTALAGMSCAGELGPVGGVNRAHAGSAVLTLFGDG